MKKKLTKSKVYFTRGVKSALIIFAILLTAGIGKKLADNYVPSVTIAETDSEAENWDITKDATGNYNLKYSGNRRVKSVKAIQLVDLGIIVNGEKVLWAATDAATKSWTDIDNKTALPSKDEWQTLKENCYWQRGTNGYYIFKPYSPDDKGFIKTSDHTYSETSGDSYIFLPDGDYWSGTESGNNAYCTSIANENINPSAEKTATSVLPFRLIKRKAEYVSIEESFVVISPDETTTLTTTNTSGKTITWKSSDTEIATVDETGKVTALKEGTVTISAFFEGDISTCEVKVDFAVPDGYVDLGVVLDNGTKVYFSSSITSTGIVWLYDQYDWPTKEDFKNLISDCYWQWDNTANHKGYYVFKAKVGDAGHGTYESSYTSSNTYSTGADQYIFLPITIDNKGFYWTGETNDVYANCLEFTESAVNTTIYDPLGSTPGLVKVIRSN